MPLYLAPLDLLKDVLEVVKRPDGHALRAHDAVRRRQVEVEVGDDVLGDVPLAREAEVAHLALHDDLGVLLAVDNARVHGLEELNRLVDARLQLFKGRLVVLKGRDVLGAEARDGKLGRVGARLDLVRQSIGISRLVCQARRKQEKPSRIWETCPLMSSIRR